MTEPELLPSSWVTSWGFTAQRARTTTVPRSAKNAPTGVWKGGRGCWRQTRPRGLLHSLAQSPFQPYIPCRNEVVVQWHLNTSTGRSTGVSAQTPEPSLGSCTIPPSLLVLPLQKVLHHARSSASAFCGCIESSPLAKLLVVVWALDYSLGPNMQVCHIGNSHRIE